MKKFLQAICYKNSKSDRSVFKGLLIIGSLVAVIVGLFTFFAFWNGLWSARVRRDRARLDSILAHQKIDVVEVISMETNRITGEMRFNELNAGVRSDVGKFSARTWKSCSNTANRLRRS